MSNSSKWAGALSKWYAQHKRDLPWRKTKEAYHIWISEIMLQQTRVETVKDYYRRFLERFPTIAALAEAPQEDVLKLWEGLGYYSRARNLQKAAQVVMADFAGVFPHEYAQILSLPGIGAYTAGAVASIAFGLPVPAIDGNVKRVASRLFGIRENIDTKQSMTAIHAALSDALAHADPSTLNQALMELGATLCTPKTPKCDLCPIAAMCDAFAEGDQDSLPVHERKSPPKALDMAVCLLTYQNRILMFQRQERLLHGLYVFKLIEHETDPTIIQTILLQDGLEAAFAAALGEAVHLFTHRKWQMHILHYELTKQPAPLWLKSNHATMADASDLLALPIPTAIKVAKSAALTLLSKG